MLYSQSYKDWDKNDIVRFYKKIELPDNSLDSDEDELNREIYVPTNVKNGTYEVELSKVYSKLYQLKGTDIYIFFRYSPYYYTSDEGILEVSYNSGTFYKKP